MKFLRTFSYVLTILVLVFLAVANRQMVSLRLVPESFDTLLGFSTAVTLPLFLVILFGIFLGLLIGLIWEYLREAKYRRQVGVQAKELKKTTDELKRVKQEAGADKDEILELLDKA